MVYKGKGGILEGFSSMEQNLEPQPKTFQILFHTTKTFLNTPFSLIYHIFTFLNLENLKNSSITYFDPRTLPQTHILTDLNFWIIHHGPNLASKWYQSSRIDG